MLKSLIHPLLALGLVCAAAPAAAQGIRCTRADLQGIADAYLAAQTSGDPLKVPFADFTEYLEQGEIGTLFSGMMSQPQKIAFQRTLLDTGACAVFTQVIVTDPAHPYVIGTRLQFTGPDNPIARSRVNSIETIITDKGDWLFDAARTLQFTRAENWGEIPVADRDSRATLIAAATAYLDSFATPGTAVPYATPCALLEGGYYTGKAAGGDDRCDGNPPRGVQTTERHFVADETIGAVAVLMQFGPGKLPDIHSFRIEKGMIRYVQATTVCTTSNCGQPLTAEMKRQLQP